MTARLARLGEVATLQAGVGFPVDLQGRNFGDYPLAKVGDISRGGRSGNSILATADHFVDENDLLRLRSRPVPAGSVLFAKIGEAIRQNHRVVAGRAMMIDNNAMAAIPGPEVASRYLYHFLRTVDLYALASSTTVPALRKSELVHIRLPLPALEEQRRIADILDRADALRVRRREALTLLDDLTQSIFLDMFGEPATNSKQLEMGIVGEVADVQGGLQVSSARARLPTKVPYLRVANVHRERLDLSEIKTLNATDSEIARTSLQTGDLLVVEGHGNPNEIGRSALWDGSVSGCVHQNHLIRVRFDQEIIDPQFGAVYLNSSAGRRFLLRSAKTTSGLNTITTTDVKRTPISLPPRHDQRAFAVRLDLVKRTRHENDAQLLWIDELFASLQQRAFAGLL
ncbi:restriction endonuclease subunit S [uncultured Jatrophihabitans sp.]|uniref:restriction endonuclease subunit S n=1 Tax=uncultured Jatrophihabitans sp. TaxID=1610747 RepID=UPI0035C9686A